MQDAMCACVIIIHVNPQAALPAILAPAAGSPEAEALRKFHVTTVATLEVRRGLPLHVACERIA